MRVKIHGPIDEAKVLDALNRALMMFQGTFGDRFQGFFGANLYLQAYDCEGQELAITNGEKEVVIHVNLQEGEIRRPPPSPRVIAIKKEHALAQQRQLREERDAEDRLLDHWVQKSAQERAALQLLQTAQQVKIDAFAKLFAAFGDQLINECNAAIAQVWDETKPCHTSGKDKGMPRSQPVIEVRNGAFFLKRNAAIPTGERIGTPLSRIAARKMETYWKYPEWVLAVERMQEVMKSLEAKLETPNS